MTAKSFLIYLMIAVAVFASVVPAQEQPRLSVGNSVEREIKPGETQSFAVSIAAGQTALVEVEQNGIEVSLAARKPDGTRFIESESPSGLNGRDTILVIAETAGDYVVEVSPADPRAVAGKYKITVAGIRPTVPNDSAVNDAARRITELANETAVLRQQATRESRRAAIERFISIIELSKIKNDRVWEVVSLLSGGVVYEQLGELQNSLSFYRRGLQAAREIGNRQYEGSSLNNLAVTYNTLGEYDNAIRYLEESIKLQRETRNRRAEAINLNNLGMAYMLRGDIIKAREFFDQSLVVRREVKDQRGEATSLNNIGTTFVRAGDIEKGVEFLTRGLDLRRQIGERQGEAISLRNIADARRRKGDVALATTLYKEANELARQLGDRRLEAETLFGLAVTQRDAGDFPAATTNVENALAIVEKIRGEFLSADIRIAYFSTIQDFYDLYTELLVSRFESTGNQADLAAALTTSERARARSLVELLGEARVDIRRGVDRELAAREEELDELLNARFRQRTQLLAGKPAADQLTRVEGEIRTIGDELDAVRVRMREVSPNYAGLKQARAVPIGEIQQMLDDETFLLEYKLGARRSFLWVVTPKTTEIFTLPPRGEIEAAAKAYFESTSVRAQDPGRTNDAARRLSFLIPDAVRERLKDRRAAIVADGILQFISFAAMPTANGEILLDRTEIVNLPSAATLAELRRNPVKSAGQRVAVFADAVFEQMDPRLKGKKSLPAVDAVRSEAIGASEPLRFQRLLSSRFEARAISGFAPARTDLNLDFEASRDRLLSGKLSDYNILHFATHGVLDAARPQFSGLALSMYGADGRAVDGFLRLDQVYNLNLSSELVVLSACRTALGRDVRGEGLIGLTRGFFYAGASRVVASLWRVDDAATAELMTRFYRKLIKEKLEPAAALRAAQLEMRKIPRFRDPYYWAGFTIQGEWRKSPTAF